ncbi:glycine--tRNA ligase subunit beta [Roseomonas sp. OT10]|uniref:glycine--tRNA ligase subunit beta n=1 Tax=Roseomonas cutis TaxID=2897332 RepID=UPI001E59FED7|nr:glycine--tRNA ligase subunit beta [Roseomonas sp. OT10]UFN48817.1 glycine--tRNA ligase subunit beta [Roseomonas sp. OT10]
MPELLLELFSEEIPARMQARAAEDLGRLLAEALKPAGLVPQDLRTFHGPRRIALAATLPEATAAVSEERRGPRADATGPALEGFLRSTGLTREQLEAREGKGGTYLYAVIRRDGRATSEVLAEAIPPLLRRFPWPKSMRWGGSSAFTWVRPLKRILCVFGGAVVPFDLRLGEDDGHGLASAELTEGHRLLHPGAFPARSLAEWQAGLRERGVIPEAGERERLIEEGVARLAAAEGLEVVPDRGLLAEVAGLVEWPVPLLGRIDDAFMDLPPEVMRTTMRVNQRYFALRHPDGRAANRFALVANIEATDGGQAIVAGNERVLRARLSDARFFWDLDRKTRLEAFLPKLDSVVFHAKLGTQGERVARLERLARWLAPKVGADAEQAARAARLAKADLATGMVGEFPELQGIMGRYYALAGGEAPEVAEAVGAHYRPLGPGDAVPSEPVAVAVALADKLDQLAGFFAVDERPTGSGDPYALRRAALGVIRIVRENGLRLSLADAFAEAFFGYPAATGTTADPRFGMAVATERQQAGFRPPAGSAHPPMVASFADGLVDFLAERLRVQLRAEGARHDVLAAVLGSGDDDLNRLLARAEALRGFLATPEGADLLAAYRRAASILRIEEKKDGPHPEGAEAHLLVAPAERALAEALAQAGPAASSALRHEDFAAAMAALAALKPPVDAFFDGVTVNDPDPALRRNRLGLLKTLRGAMDRVADFSKIEG